MNFRRVAEHLKHLHWTTIAIDLVVVVVGVFIGMQASNWNAERETNQRAAVFTKRLKADLRVEAWGYEFLIDYNKDVLANAERALAAMTDNRPMSDEQLVISAYRASQYEFQDRRRATYDELVSTGSISLIANQNMRETAISVYSSPLFDQILNEGKQSEYRELFRKTVSASVQRELLTQCGDRLVQALDYGGIVHSLDYPCALGVPTDKIRAAAQALRLREGLVSVLQLRFADLETDLVNLQQYNPQLLRLREFSERGK